MRVFSSKEIQRVRLLEHLNSPLEFPAVSLPTWLFDTICKRESASGNFRLHIITE